ncbi:MAG: hypothetical protein BWY32_03323 [bacterium ADurb.Bin243]|nr:MAG: hypothetical protein BWY32_03323 [bacterium ADurb.Bin243]HOD40064.1 hypothetical protein [Candidatus Wallbacteria bacterium]
MNVKTNNYGPIVSNDATERLARNDIKPVTAYKTDIIYNGLAYFTRHNPFYTVLFYFFVSYVMTYVIGILSGQLNGGGGRNPMHTYILDNLCMGILAPIGAGLITNLYKKISDATGIIGAKRIIKDGDLRAYQALLNKFDAKFNNYYITAASTILAFLISAFIYFHRKTSWLGIAGGITGIYDSIFVFLNFAMIITIVYKSCITIWLIQKIISFDINIRPMHPDHAGGLRHIGSLSMAVNYFLILVMFYFSLLLIFDAFAQRFILIYLFFYVFTFFIFFASLYEAHKKMRRVKDEALEKLENTSNHYYYKLVTSAGALGIYDLDSADEIIMVDNLYTIVEKMPVWPFNINNIIKFFSVFITPLIIFIISLLVNTDSILYNWKLIFNLLTK